MEATWGSPTPEGVKAVSPTFTFALIWQFTYIIANFSNNPTGRISYPHFRKEILSSSEVLWREALCMRPLHETFERSLHSLHRVVVGQAVIRGVESGL